MRRIGEKYSRKFSMLSLGDSGRINGKMQVTLRKDRYSNLVMVQTRHIEDLRIATGTYVLTLEIRISHIKT